MNAKRPRPTGTTGKSDVAAEAWRLMAEFSFAEFKNSGQLEILREMGLTPGHLKALAVLDPDEPRPMRAMADALACDASMVTWLVDRLEERGLVERRTSPTDRRVKTLILTPLGIRTRVRLVDAMYTPPPGLAALDLASLEALREALRKLPLPERPFWSSTPAEHTAGEPAAAATEAV